MLFQISRPRFWPAAGPWLAIVIDGSGAPGAPLSTNVLLTTRVRSVPFTISARPPFQRATRLLATYVLVTLRSGSCGTFPSMIAVPKFRPAATDVQENVLRVMRRFVD